MTIWIIWFITLGADPHIPGVTVRQYATFKSWEECIQYQEIALEDEKIRVLEPCAIRDDHPG